MTTIPTRAATALRIFELIEECVSAHKKGCLCAETSAPGILAARDEAIMLALADWVEDEFGVQAEARFLTHSHNLGLIK